MWLGNMLGQRLDTLPKKKSRVKSVSHQSVTSTCQSPYKSYIKTCKQTSHFRIHFGIWIPLTTHRSVRFTTSWAIHKMRLHVNKAISQLSYHKSANMSDMSLWNPNVCWLTHHFPCSPDHQCQSPPLPAGKCPAAPSAPSAQARHSPKPGASRIVAPKRRH